MSNRILRRPEIGPISATSDALPPAVREALDAAYERGLTEGYERGRGDLAQHALVLATKLDATDTRLVETVRAATTRDARSIIDLACELAEWFVGQALENDTEAIVSSLQSAFAEMRPGSLYELSVHPDVAEAVSGKLPREISALNPDPSLSPGELRLSSDAVVIERVWHQAIDRVRHGIAEQVDKDRLGTPAQP